jgi:hypothetical protein
MLTSVSCLLFINTSSNADEVEVVQADEEVCIAIGKSQVDILGGKMECLSGKDLMAYD